MIRRCGNCRDGRAFHPVIPFLDLVCRSFPSPYRGKHRARGYFACRQWVLRRQPAEETSV